MSIETLLVIIVVCFVWMMGYCFRSQFQASEHRHRELQEQLTQMEMNADDNSKYLDEHLDVIIKQIQRLSSS